MRNSKNKYLAALLAFFGGIIGLHRFYLEQKGLGIMMIFLSLISIGIIGSIIGIIDSIIFLNMSNEKFEFKYNNPDQLPGHGTRKTRYKSYEKKRQPSPYMGESKSSHRKDRRMARSEFSELKNERSRTHQSFDRNSSKRRSSGKVAYGKKEALRKINELKESGIAKFKDYDIEGSIQNFMEILKIDPYHIAAHFNLACGYSQLEKPQKTMYHLSMAVKAGFDDFDRIRTHEKLAYARIQPEWENFAKNGFIFDVNKENPANTNTEEFIENKQAIDSSREKAEDEEVETVDLLKHLNNLKEQRERGIISETEFEIERRKLMSS